jgi:spore coat polysaccharide biosynthesis protein SpsF
MRRGPALRDTRVIIQARMSSGRFPGKALAPFAGKPLVMAVVNRIEDVFDRHLITVATSTEVSDDPLAIYLQAQGVGVYRGPLNDVFERFRGCLDSNPADWFVRVCADSPFLDSQLLRRVITSSRSAFDLVTNIQERTFPRGQSVELVRAAAFLSVDPAELVEEDREHVTPIFYRDPQRFRILNLTSADPSLAAESHAVDTVEDLRRLERKQAGIQGDGPW